VSGVLFVAVASDREVQDVAYRVLKARSLTAGFRWEVRSFVREHVKDYFDEDGQNCLISFWSESVSQPFLDYDVDRLLQVALGDRCDEGACSYGQPCGAWSCVPSRLRAKAIRWLLKHFPADAQNVARAAGVSQEGNGSYH
jgi:hypothetical protein